MNGYTASVGTSYEDVEEHIRKGTNLLFIFNTIEEISKLIVGMTDKDR